MIIELIKIDNPIEVKILVETMINGVVDHTNILELSDLKKPCRMHAKGYDELRISLLKVYKCKN